MEVGLIRRVAAEANHIIEIMADLPRSRVQGEGGHSYDARAATIANGRTAELLVKMLG